MSSKRPTKLDNLILIGDQMSNVFFNLGQADGPLAKHRELQVQWDKARRELFNAMKPKKRGAKK